MTTTSSPLWTIADRLEITPMRPDPFIAASIASWWEYPLGFACAHARHLNAQWFTVFPDPRVRCVPCGMSHLQRPGECVYCREHTNPDVDDLLMFETRASTIAFTTHPECHAKRAGVDRG